MDAKLRKPIQTQIESTKKFIVVLTKNDWTNTEYILNKTEGLDDNYIEASSALKTRGKNKLTDKERQAEIKAEKEDRKRKSVKLAADLYKQEYQIVKSVLKKRNQILKATKGFHDNKLVMEFYNLSQVILDIHFTRTEEYLQSEKSEDLPEEIKQSEVDFMLTVNDGSFDITFLSTDESLDTDFDSGDIKLHETTPMAQLIMYKHFFSEHPEIRTKLESQGIDFDPEIDNRMHIYNVKAPIWNPRRHFFDQDPETLQYYIKELKKCRRGIKIGNQFIEPWMYFHINYFMTLIPTKVVIDGVVGNEDVIRNPPLRDNEWYIIQDTYPDAKKENKIMFIAATRRFSKSTLIASHLHWKLVTGARRMLIASSTTEDLGHITANMKISMSNVNKAFYTYTMNADWSKEVILGAKYKTNTRLEMCNIKIINMDGGAESASEKLAGFTPDAFVIDEIMKSKFKKHLEAALPAIQAPDGWRCVPILSGTGGNGNLAEDAFSMLKNPDTNLVLEMNWEKLNSKVPMQARTWREQKFGTFAPAQMSAKTGMVKIKTNLAEYLGEVNEELAGIEILVTDWENSKKIIERDRELYRPDRVKYIKEMVYFPMSPEEIFMSDKVSPFPIDAAREHLAKIREEGNTGRKVRVFNTNEGIVFKDCDDELPTFPHSGGNFDSPIVLFDQVPENPPMDLYVSSLDDYKQESSQSSSLGCFYVLKRQSGNDPMGNRIVATLTTRPTPHRKFHQDGYLLIKSFNAMCLMENEDMEFKVYLDTKKESDRWLVPTFDLKGNFTIQTNSHRKYGISPKGNRSQIIAAAAAYCNEDIELPDGKGGVREGLGVERINDELLLEEIINYNEDLNVDRITAFGIGLIQMHFLDTNYRMVPIMHSEGERKRERPKIRRAGSAFGKGGLGGKSAFKRIAGI